MRYLTKMSNRLTAHNAQGDRLYMEDRVSIAYNEVADEGELDEKDKCYQYLYVGIFDGHGGYEAAQFAKENLEENITTQRGFWKVQNDAVLKAIREGFLQTHNAMWKEQEKWPKTHAGFPSTSGTTSSVAFIKNGSLYIGHVGDSKIVLGELDEGGKYPWKAVELTQDHKPESPEEKSRIQQAGGKVVSKSGVPRVVWHRPKANQPQGRQLRSTKTEDVPFLAIGRSLGDLWSYNSSTGQFVVSPDPDLTSIQLDTAKHKCLIFATDGLWNVISPQSSVNIAYNAVEDGLDPSEVLVDEALHRWNINEKRADNVSVVTVILAVDDNILPQTENIGFFTNATTTTTTTSNTTPTTPTVDEVEDVEMYPNDRAFYDDPTYPKYQDISHMAAVDGCEVLEKVKQSPENNAIFPKCVMRHASTFERYDYMSQSS